MKLKHNTIIILENKQITNWSTMVFSCNGGPNQSKTFVYLYFVDVTYHLIFKPIEFISETFDFISQIFDFISATFELISETFDLIFETFE